jgi:hypothetical protein
LLFGILSHQHGNITCRKKCIKKKRLARVVLTHGAQKLQKMLKFSLHNKRCISQETLEEKSVILRVPCVLKLFTCAQLTTLLLLRVPKKQPPLSCKTKNNPHMANMDRSNVNSATIQSDPPPTPQNFSFLFFTFIFPLFLTEIYIYIYTRIKFRYNFLG